MGDLSQRGIGRREQAQKRPEVLGAEGEAVREPAASADGLGALRRAPQLALLPGELLRDLVGVVLRGRALLSENGAPFPMGDGSGGARERRVERA